MWSDQGGNHTRDNGQCEEILIQDRSQRAAFNDEIKPDSDPEHQIYEKKIESKKTFSLQDPEMMAKQSPFINHNKIGVSQDESKKIEPVN